jgi:hypothetical protein
MKQRLGDKKDMPDVPKMTFTDALAEIWSQINYAAYHMAFVQVYSQSEALRTPAQVVRIQTQETRDAAQTDVLICRSHLGAFFWHLEHVYEALRAAITRGQKEYPTEKYFWSYATRLETWEQSPLRGEIRDYRNIGHQTPGIIGAAWDPQGKFLHHFLPTVSGHTPREDVDMNTRLQQYFEFTANVWLDFAPGDCKNRFPRDFRFPVTVPFLYVGQIPDGLKKVPQFEVVVQSYQKEQNEEFDSPPTASSDGSSSIPG